MMRASKRPIGPITAVLLAALILPVQMGGCPDLLAFLLGWSAPDGAVDVTPAEAQSLITEHAGDPGFIVLDVRTASEYGSGHIEGAINICITCVVSFAEDLAALDPDATYLVYGKSGLRSTNAVAVMVDEGFTNIYHMVDGLDAWVAAGLPVVESE